MDSPKTVLGYYRPLHCAAGNLHCFKLGRPRSLICKVLDIKNVSLLDTCMIIEILNWEEKKATGAITAKIFIT